MSLETSRLPLTQNIISGSLQHSTLKDSTEAMLRRALLDGEMKPGEIYSANAIATQLGLSNSPVREAMMSLVNRGLLELVRNRGFRVVELDDKDKREVYDLRLLVEVEAVRRISSRGLSENQIAELRALCQKTIDLTNGSLSEYLEADQEFHLKLVELLGNRRWLEIVEQLRDQSRVNGSYEHLEGDGKLLASAQEHEQITNAVIGGEPELAAALMIQHLEYARPETR